MFHIDGTQLTRELKLDDIKAACGGGITFCACVHKLRKMPGFTFVMVRTGRYLLQAVYDEKLCASDISSLCEGAYIELSGRVKEEPRAEYGYEICLTDFSVLSAPAAEFPLQISDRVLGCALDANMEHRALALRHPIERAVFEISDGAQSGFREFMKKNDFTEIHTPKICAANAEGGTSIFRLKYFGSDAMLAQSPQLYKQACVAIFDRVFEIGAAYRAEKHNSARHLNEYISLDFEMGYINSMTDVMETGAALLRYIIAYLNEHYGHELAILGARLPTIGAIPAVTFFEAMDILGKTHDMPDLDPTDEVKLSEYARREHNSEFIFVTRLPGAKRPFYVMDCPDDAALSESFELLYGGMEIATGGQRIHDYRAQLEKLERRGVAPDEPEACLLAHKYGLPPHGGLGMGLERLVMKLLGLRDIRQASLFPRDMHHLTP